MKPDGKGFWSPYVCGFLTGLLVIASVWLTGKFFGASTTMVKSAGMAERFFRPETVERLEYYIKINPGIDWQWMFVFGIIIGSFFSSLISRSFKFTAFPEMWQERFGKNLKKRCLYAFGGGFISILGARLAGGCPSGHGLSGLMQMAVSGYLSLFSFFFGGILTAHFIFRQRRGS